MRKRIDEDELDRIPLLLTLMMLVDLLTRSRGFMQEVYQQIPARTEVVLFRLSTLAVVGICTWMSIRTGPWWSGITTFLAIQATVVVMAWIAANTAMWLGRHLDDRRDR